MAGDDGISMPADTMRERGDESGFKVWLLVEANRWVVAALVVLALFAMLVVLEAVGPSDLGKLVATDAPGSAFTSAIIALVTSVTLVLTVSQLVLSREIGGLGEKSDQLWEEIEFRESVEAESDIGVAPAEPSAFLRALVETTDERADRLRDAVAASDAPDELSPVASYAEQVSDHGDTVLTELEGAEFGTFDVVQAALNYNYAWKIYAARVLREEHADALDDAVGERFEELLEALRFFAPSREYLKALYFQWEIVNVARETMYGVIPALAIAGYMILGFDAGGVSGATLGVHNRYLFVSAVYAISLTPFAVLLAYILRILTVVQRTLSLGPFILREEQHAGDVRVDD